MNSNKPSHTGRAPNDRRQLHSTTLMPGFAVVLYGFAAVPRGRMACSANAREEKIIRLDCERVLAACARSEQSRMEGVRSGAVREAAFSLGIFTFPLALQ